MRSGSLLPCLPTPLSQDPALTLFAGRRLLRCRVRDCLGGPNVVDTRNIKRRFFHGILKLSAIHPPSPGRFEGSNLQLLQPAANGHDFKTIPRIIIEINHFKSSKDLLLVFNNSLL
ncbi:hypothetical protein M9H77_34079 [Catharanthus roseus]|uniref:Uncharacterized protein n=1 Tax=Catharanthus roseus TaxID=4058 RepID=A0ACB9ZLV8_CATRO|nr:hypothetical protein M9H77_34079 [Catharanthus roseus]